MDAGNIVKIRFKRYFHSQRLWVFVGKLVEFTENWIKVDGRGIIFTTGQLGPIDMDEESRVLIIPRENIAHIRILPDEFDVDKIEPYKKNFRWLIKVPNGPDASLGEIGETT